METKIRKCIKRRFYTKEEADRGLIQLQALNYSINKDKKNKDLRPYLCPYCGYYHIGHKGKRKE